MPMHDKCKGLHKEGTVYSATIRKISPGAYIFLRPFLRGLFLEGVYLKGIIYGGKFVFQNRLGQPYGWK